MWTLELYVCLPYSMLLTDTIQFYFPVLGLGLCGDNKLAKSVPAMCLTGPFLSYSSFEFSKGWGSEFIKIT